MTDTQFLFVGFGLVAAAIFAVVGFELAPADPATGIVLPKKRWNWAAGAAVETVVNLGALFELLDLKHGAPTGARIAGIGLGALCAVLAALVAYIVHGDEDRSPRWQKTGGSFTAAMVVLVILVKVVS